MLDLRDIAALQDLRAAFETSAAPGEYPGTCAGELLLLQDVCAALGLGAEGTRQVLGDPAAAYLAELTGAEGAAYDTPRPQNAGPRGYRYGVRCDLGRGWPRRAGAL